MDATTHPARDAGRPWFGRPAVTSCLCFVLVALGALAPASRAEDPSAAAGSTTGVTAQNLNITIQILWQVQEGCARYCTGTHQLQTAGQTATTVQVATATATGAGAAATAANTSATIQVIVQTQLGCVAFCSGTALTQDATQHAEATQLATAVSTALASAVNDARTTQLVWQFQQGCESDCYDTSSIQTSAQTQGGGAAASSAGGTAAPSLESVLAWIATIAAQATVDVVEQHDVAACLEHCDGGVQVQVSVQEARTGQVSIASDAPAAADQTAVADATAAADAPQAAPVAEPAPATGVAAVAPARGPIVVVATVARPGARHVAARRHVPPRLRQARCTRRMSIKLRVPHSRTALRRMVHPKPKPRQLVTGGILCGS
jgi:hypothetical protein